MFDSLRDQMNGDQSFNADSAFGSEPDFSTPAVQAPKQGRFLGMTPVQRLVISLLVFLSVCILGSMCLMITGAVRIP